MHLIKAGNKCCPNTQASQVTPHCRLLHMKCEDECLHPVHSGDSKCWKLSVLFCCSQPILHLCHLSATLCCLFLIYIFYFIIVVGHFDTPGCYWLDLHSNLCEQSYSQYLQYGHHINSKGTCTYASV